MRQFVTRAGVSLAALLGIIACMRVDSAVAQVEPADEGIHEIDDRTPEAALREFYRAIAKGDAKLARQLLVAPQEMAEWTEIQAAMSDSSRNLGEAAVAHFGDEGKSLAGLTPAEIALRKLDTVKVVVNGDTAEWPTNPKVPMKLKAIDGHWKLDLYTSFKSPEDLKLVNDVSKRVGEYVGKVAAGIAAGKFETVAEVRQELKRQRAAMNRDLSQ